MTRIKDLTKENKILALISCTCSPWIGPGSWYYSPLGGDWNTLKIMKQYFHKYASSLIKFSLECQSDQ